MNTLEGIAQALAGGEDVLCTHALERQEMPPLSLLADLGLAKPIRTSVPKCSEHTCPYRGDCEHEAVFESGAPGRAGRKARPAKDAAALAADAERLRARVRALPLCEFVLAALAEGPRSIFALNTLLVERSLREIDEAGQAKAAAFTRAGLGQALALLGELGLVRRSADGGSVAAYHEPV